MILGFVILGLPIHEKILSQTHIQGITFFGVNIKHMCNQHVILWFCIKHGHSSTNPYFLGIPPSLDQTIEDYFSPNKLH